MITVASITKTCPRYPAQWEGLTEDGKHLYVRFRYGYLQIGLGATPDEALDDESGFGCQLTVEPSGILSYEDLKHVTLGMIVWPETESKP